MLLNFKTTVFNFFFILIPLCAVAQQTILPIYLSNDSPKFNSLLKGCWKSLGYGKVLEIKDSSFQIFHTTKNYCYKDIEESAEDFNNHYTHFYYNDDNKILHLYSRHIDGINNSAYQFIRLKEPVDCKEETTKKSPPFIFDVFWNTFNDHYAFFKERKIDWNKVYYKYKPMINDSTNEQILFQYLSEIIKPFSDPHINLIHGDSIYKAGQPKNFPYLKEKFKEQDTFYKFNDYTKDWYKKQVDLIPNEFGLKEFKKVANDKIQWGEIAPGIGYVNILLMTDFVKEDGVARKDQLLIVEREIDIIIDSFKDYKAIIVDVSLNQGGNDETGLLITSRFADKKRQVYKKYPKGIVEKNALKIFVSPGGKKQFTRPVYLLTSNITVSAAEVFVLAMKALPHVKLVGENTRGAFSDMLNKPLGNSFHVTLSNEMYLDKKNNCFESIGISPDSPFQLFPSTNLDNGRKEAITFIIKEINNM